MLELGQQIDGKYTIVRLIGQGGMGAVFEGINRLIDRRVAIKVLLPTADPHAVQRFEQEARAAGRIGNDHILEILDLGTLEDGSRYMVAEYLEGEPLDARIENRGRVPLEELVPIATQLLSGLAAAHAAGVVHRDLKPDNVFILKEKAGRKDFVKIIDFGISKFSQVDSEGMNLTRTGSLMGTPYFMSPEQARGAGGVDHRADLYAVGVILYNAVSGQLPYNAQSLNELLFKVALERPPPLSSLAPTLDPAFIRIIDRAMARDPGDRYQSAREFGEALQSWAAAQRASQLSGLPALFPAVGLDSGVLEAQQISAAPTYPDELSPQRPRTPAVAGRSAPTPGPFAGTSPLLQTEVEALPVRRRGWLLGAGVGALLGVAGLVFALRGGASSAASGEEGAAVAESGQLEPPAGTSAALEVPADSSPPTQPDPAAAPPAGEPTLLDTAQKNAAQEDAASPVEENSTALSAAKSLPKAGSSRARTTSSRSVAAPPAPPPAPEPSPVAEPPAPPPVSSPPPVSAPPPPAPKPKKPQKGGFNFGY